MNDVNLHSLIESLVNGTISGEDHHALQELLKADPGARAVFRERMDLETGLRTWATESPVGRATEPVAKTPESSGRGWTRAGIAAVAIAVAAAVLVLVLPGLRNNDDPDAVIVENPPPGNEPQTPSERALGSVRQQADCTWAENPATRDGQFTTGRFALTAGAAEFRFDSGTDLVLESPGELVVTSAASARLLGGQAFVHVTEISSGFTLETPEARIVDEGTTYAVVLDEESAEVHVFDGSVIWVPQGAAADGEDRIEAGQATRYPRAQPTNPQRIPFGQRQFVRRIEIDVQDRGGDALLAYDGFENLAGRIRRDRSGFGWAGGWEPGDRGRGRLAEIVDAPEDVVFGFDRSGRRLLSLEHGDDIRRNLEFPQSLQTGGACYVGMLIERRPGGGQGERSFQAVLESKEFRRGHRRKEGLSFGVTTEGFPFTNNGTSITRTASPIIDGRVYFCVAKFATDGQSVTPFLRLYGPGETIDTDERFVWTVAGTTGTGTPVGESIRLIAGRDTTWHVDELKVGQTWGSVTDLGHPKP